MNLTLTIAEDRPKPGLRFSAQSSSEMETVTVVRSEADGSPDLIARSLRSIADSISPEKPIVVTHSGDMDAEVIARHVKDALRRAGDYA